MQTSDVNISVLVLTGPQPEDLTPAFSKAPFTRGRLRVKTTRYFIGSAFRLDCGPVYTKGNADISTRFGLSFTRKRSFYHRKRSFLKTLAKVEISENAGYVLSCQRGETGF
jgi:hypothetical protein